MKKYIISLTIIILSSQCLNAQSFEWVKSVGGTRGDYIRSMTVDDSGNFLISAIYRDTVDLDPGPGTARQIATGISDCFILKLDKSGNYKWSLSFGATGYVESKQIAVDASGNIYILGRFDDQIDFSGWNNSTVLKGKGSSQVFLLKLDPSGTFIWAKSIGGLSNTLASSLSLDKYSNLYATGYFYGSVDFDPGIDSFNLTSNGQNDIFVLKVDSSGKFVWAKSIGAEERDEGVAIEWNENGNLYLTGSFESQVDFDRILKNYTLSSEGSADIFLAKMDSNGSIIWVRSVGNQEDQRPYCITVDQEENIITAGRFKGKLDFDPGKDTFYLNSATFNLWIQKLDSSGSFVWAKSIVSNGENYLYSIDSDEKGNIYTTGAFEYTADFDPGNDTLKLTPYSIDYFLQKLDSQGNFLWVNHITSKSDEISGRHVKVDNKYNIYSVGNFAGTADFDHTSESKELTSEGGDDVFILKLSQVEPSNLLIGQHLIDFTVFPNPGKGKFNLKFHTPVTDGILSILDINGKQIFSQQCDCRASDQIDLQVAPGLYYLSIKTASSHGVVKLLVQ